MAIINSITIGSASGKVGNVSLSKKGAKSIARSLPVAPAGGWSELQVLQRARMTNVLKCVNYLTFYMKSYNAWGKSQKERNSYLISQLYSLITTTTPTAPNVILSNIQNTYLKLPRGIRLYSVQFGEYDLTVLCSKNGCVVNENVVAKAFLFNSNNTNIHFVENTLVYQQINGGFFAISPITAWSTAIVWVEHKDPQITSNIIIVHR